MWKVIKEIRKDFLLKNLTRVCQDSNTLLHDYYIFENTKMIEKSLDIETDYESHGNVTKETIEAGVKMFTYLNLCPPMMMKYFEELLLKGTLKEIILSTSAIIRKSKKAVKKSAIDLFQKIGQKLGFKHRKIDLITKRKSIFIENYLRNCSTDLCRKDLNFLGLCANYEFQIILLQILGSKEIHKITTHPGQIIDEDGHMMPTALVPFCSLSNNFYAMGAKIEQIDIPVCKSFRDRIVNDQLCQQVDLNKYKAKFKPNEKLFFSFFIDFNEEREYLENDHDIGKLIKIESIGISL